MYHNPSLQGKASLQSWISSLCNAIGGCRIVFMIAAIDVRDVRLTSLTRHAHRQLFIVIPTSPRKFVPHEVWEAWDAPNRRLKARICSSCACRAASPVHGLVERTGMVTGNRHYSQNDREERKRRERCQRTLIEPLPNHIICKNNKTRLRVAP